MFYSQNLILSQAMLSEGGIIQQDYACLERKFISQDIGTRIGSDGELRTGHRSRRLESQGNSLSHIKRFTTKEYGFHFNATILNAQQFSLHEIA